MREVESDIRTSTLLKLAEHMKSISRMNMELNKEIESMMQDIMWDLRRESIVEKHIEEKDDGKDIQSADE